MSGRNATRTADVAVIGAGIVGLSCAWQLQRRGLRVAVLDPKGPAGETSAGNAGSISVGNLLPQATPGIAWKGLRMLADAHAPLKLDWARLPGYARWLLDFVRSAAPPRLTPAIDALHAINSASRRAWMELAAALDAEDLLEHSGYLHVYSRERSFADGEWERGLMRARGVRFEVLDAAGLRDLEPGLGAGFERGVFQTEALAMRDPAAFCRRLHARLVDGGAQDLRLRVHAARAQPGGDWRLDTDGAPLACAELVVAAGAWSRALLAPLGIDVPVIPARGYHLMFANRPGLARRPTLWAERYMVMTPMLGGVRVTSIKELTALDREPRYALIRRLAPEARRLYPALDPSPQSEWAGNRPCTPDSLPIIDRLEGRRLSLALGHGHLGLTQGPVTGELVAQRLVGDAPTLPFAPYALARFA